MKKTTKLIALFLSCAMLAPAFVSANPEERSAPESGTVTAEAPAAVQPQTTWEKILANLPKVSGYLQTGWNYTSNDKSSSSSFQAKRLRLLLDGKVSEKVDFRLQIEAFNGISGSTNGNGQKNIQVMDAFATWKIRPEFKVRFGQFYTPLGYENYDISPATLETVDFSNIVYRMACRKRRANAGRPDGEKYAELQRVRLGSRLPAYLPMRVNDELVEILREFREKASAVGVKQFIVQTHFQTPLEVTPEAEEAIRKILSAGWLITNQLVYTVAASRRGHTARLRQVLNSLGVVCYYTFSVKGFEENRAVFTPNSRSMQEQVEEKVYGRLTPEQAAELDDLLADGTDTAAKIRCFMRRHHLPFLATDRSVLNLPAIGKSMSFRLVGITAEGKRLLRFDHDRTRRHSPIIDRMGEIFIVESKSVAAYLRQLGKMGEDPEDYASIWAYTRGETEPRFGLYEYPGFDFGVTDRMSNLEL